MGFSSIEEIPCFFNIQGIFKKNIVRSFSKFCFGCWHIKLCLKLCSLLFVQGIYCTWRKVVFILHAQTAGLGTAAPSSIHEFFTFTGLLNSWTLLDDDLLFHFSLLSPITVSAQNKGWFQRELWNYLFLGGCRKSCENICHSGIWRIALRVPLEN